MKKIVHKSDTRGHANHGWLDSHHTFSFANYYDPQRMHFGVLRVLNDDIVTGGQGFGSHPHENMEIISIPLKGDLEHMDSMGNKMVIEENDIQVMSAGTGVYHSEYNRNKDRLTNFLQIWIFPNKRDVTPRYDQMKFQPEGRKNALQQILSPNQDDEGVWIHQDAWFHRGLFEKETTFEYKLKKQGNGIYVFVIEGSMTIAGENISKRDGLGIWETDKISIEVTEDAEVLIMEVPMELN